MAPDAPEPEAEAPGPAPPPAAAAGGLVLASAGGDPRFNPKAFVASLSTRPGVYRMLDAAGTVIYVGKAKNLKARVGSYFRADQIHPKVHALVQQIAGIDVTVTRSATEALLLEYNLIKQHKPRYNIVMRDDKSFPFLYLTTKDEFPRLSFYRGSRRLPGRFFGPYPSTAAVRETLLQLQKLFKLRQCDDIYFANRTRPCLQYQIERCSAPCVGLIGREDYATDVNAAVRVLEGRNDEVATELSGRMEVAAGALEFERAATLRDQLAAVRQIQAKQIVSAEAALDCDAVAVAQGPGEYCIGLMFIRGGQNLGTTTYFARAPLAEAEEVLGAFLAQHYLGHPPPEEILIESEVADADVLESVLSESSP